MNFVDILLILIFFVAIWIGWQKGFILGTVNLIVWLGSLFIAFASYSYLSNLMQRWFPALGVWNLPLSFFLIIVLSRVVLAFLFNRILDRTPLESHQSLPNRALGVIPGAINGLIYAIVAAALLLSMPISNVVSETTRKSLIAGKLGNEVQWLDEKLSPIFNPAVQKTMAGLTVEPGSNETVILHFKVKDAVPRPDLEQQMLVLVNQERTKRGIKPLQLDTSLRVVARAHSEDMFQEGYFSHYTLQGEDPFQRMHDHNVHFITAGENLALGQTLPICHEGLMNSPGHKANILNPSFGRLGIGILDGGFHGLMISQEFRN